MALHFKILTSCLHFIITFDFIYFLFLFQFLSQLLTFSVVRHWTIPATLADVCHLAYSALHFHLSYYHQRLKSRPAAMDAADAFHQPVVHPMESVPMAVHIPVEAKTNINMIWHSYTPVSNPFHMHSHSPNKTYGKTLYRSRWIWSHARPSWTLLLQWGWLLVAGLGRIWRTADTARRWKPLRHLGISPSWHGKLVICYRNF